MSLPSVEMGSLFLAARLARVSDSDDDISQAFEVRVQYCSCLRANFGPSDHDSRSGGPCPRFEHSHSSSSDVIRFAERRVPCSAVQCRVQSAGLDAHPTSRTNAPPLSGRVVWLPAWCAGSRRRGLKYSLCATQADPATIII